MKRMWFAAGILAFLLAATLTSSFAIGEITGQLTGLLRQAEASARSGDWDRTETLTSQAQKKWERHSGYLYVVLRHSDTDQVNTGFQEVLAFIRHQDNGEYASSNARLTAQIGLLSEMERFNLKNLL